MLDTDFEVSLVKQDSRAIVYASGELDITTAERFRDALRVAQDGSADVIVDLSQVTFIDASGVNALVSAYRGASDGGELRVVGASPTVRRVFEILRLSEPLLDKPEVDPARAATGRDDLARGAGRGAGSTSSVG